MYVMEHFSGGRGVGVGGAGIENGSLLVTVSRKYIFCEEFRRPKCYS